MESCQNGILTALSMRNLIGSSNTLTVLTKYKDVVSCGVTPATYCV